MHGFKKAGEVAVQSAKTRLGSFLKRVRAKYAMNPCTWVRPYGALTEADLMASAADEAFLDRWGCCRKRRHAPAPSPLNQ